MGNEAFIDVSKRNDYMREIMSEFAVNERVRHCRIVRIRLKRK